VSGGAAGWWSEIDTEPFTQVLQRRVDELVYRVADTAAMLAKPNRSLGRPMAPPISE
jgi:hypothetical protein